MIEWEGKTLDELGFVGRGKSRHRPRNAAHLYGGEYPLIQTGDVQSADFYINKYTQTYSDAGLSQSKLWPKNTLCISIVGANTAASAILRFDACFPDSVIGFIPKKGISDVRFVKYSLELLRFHLKSISEGTARENLSLEKILAVKIPMPSFEYQTKIASILSAYDDLIENNLKRIKLLEELGQRTYEDWFVKFRVNGERLILNKETGLPVGWEFEKVGIF
jgi:type I restriction enzyme S subunit